MGGSIEVVQRICAGLLIACTFLGSACRGEDDVAAAFNRLEERCKSESVRSLVNKIREMFSNKNFSERRKAIIALSDIRAKDVLFEILQDNDLQCQELSFELLEPMMDAQDLETLCKVSLRFAEIPIGSDGEKNAVVQAIFQRMFQLAEKLVGLDRSPPPSRDRMSTVDWWTNLLKRLDDAKVDALAARKERIRDLLGKQE